MIRMIAGEVVDVGANNVVVLSYGVGYLVFTPSLSAPELGSQTKLYTHLAVRETALDLYGFPDKQTLMTFELLLTIPKIGPKSALQILEQASPSLLQEAVTLQDATHLSKLSGIGKKTAENIIMGLKDKLDIDTANTTHSKTTTLDQDAFDALVALGYSPQQVREVLANNTANDTQSAIKAALKQL